MVSPLFFYQLVLVALVWLCVMLHWAWPSDPAAVCPTTPEPPGPRARIPAARLPATPYRAHAGTAAPGGDLFPLLPRCPLRLSGLGRAGQSQCQWASQRWPVAPAVLHGLWGLFPRDPRHAVAWQARGAREAGVGGGRTGGGLGHPCRGPRLRG